MMMTMKSSSKCSSPYTSAPSSPHHPLNLFFYSTPTSPRLSSSPPSHHNTFFFGDDLDQLPLLPPHHHQVPFNWELMPGVPKQEASTQPNGSHESSFDFDFSGHLHPMLTPSLTSADQLFDGGKIRPLKPPPGLQNPPSSDSPKSPPTPIMSKFRDALSLSPRQRPTHRDDPFEAALQNSTRNDTPQHHRGRARGRPEDSNGGSMRIKGGSSVRRGYSRSLSPLRVSEFALLQQQQQQTPEHTNPNDENHSLSSSRGGSKKWRLKDLFLFRSASEGRAATSASGGKDPLRKLFSFSRRNSMDKDGSSHNNRMNDSKNSSFRSTISRGSMSRRRGGGHEAKVSAHEMHYTAKRAVSEELKKKTSLAYKHGLLSCWGFNPLIQELSNTLGSLKTPSSS